MRRALILAVGILLVASVVGAQTSVSGVANQITVTETGTLFARGGKGASGANPGVALRLNGYRMPKETEEMAKAKSASLGSPASKKLWPRTDR
jgi:hypothetical protein